MICENCIKKEVCKYAEQTKKFEETKKEESLLENITVIYKCKHKNNGQLFRGTD